MRHLATAGAILLALASAAPAKARAPHSTPRARAVLVDLVAAAARRHGVRVALRLAIVEAESGTACDAGCSGPLLDAAADPDCSADARWRAA